MQGLNKAISFILGLIVVVVFIAIVSGRIKLGNIIPSLSKVPIVKTTPTPTFTPTPTMTKPGDAMQQQPGTVTNNYRSTGNTKGGSTQTISNAKTIPNTGAPTLLIPFALSSGVVGFFLRKIGKRKNA